MTVSESVVKHILKIYGEAWSEQRVDKLLSIFLETATYHEDVFEKPFIGNKEIAEYWESKVVQEESDIEFKLLNYYISGNFVTAEWDASFNSNIKNARIHIREVAIIEIYDDKILSLREYWHTEKKEA